MGTDRKAVTAVVDDATERAGNVILAERAGKVSYISAEGALEFKPVVVLDRLITLAIDQLQADRDSLRARRYHPYGEFPYFQITDA